MCNYQINWGNVNNTVYNYHFFPFSGGEGNVTRRPPLVCCIFMLSEQFNWKVVFAWSLHLRINSSSAQSWGYSAASLQAIFVTSGFRLDKETWFLACSLSCLEDFLREKTSDYLSGKVECFWSLQQLSKK